MFKQKKLKALLKTNPTLYDILRSDLCTYFVKGVGKSKKEILPYMLQERMVLDMIDCIAVKELQPDSAHLCHYASVIFQSGNKELMNSIDVPNSLYYFAWSLKALFDYNPQKVCQYLIENKQYNVMLINSSYWSSHICNTIVHFFSSKQASQTWIEIFLQIVFETLTSQPQITVVIFLYLSKVITNLAEQIRSIFLERVNEDLFLSIIDLLQYPETTILAHHTYNSLTYYCGMRPGLVETFFATTNKRALYFGKLLVHPSAKVSHAALMIIQSHVANGNYEILQTVFPYIFESMFKYENRTVFCQEALTTIGYLWSPKNNANSDRIPLIKKIFKELNIASKIDDYLEIKPGGVKFNLKPLKPWLLKVLMLIPSDEMTVDYDTRIKSLHFLPSNESMPSYKLKKKLEKHRQTIMSDKTRSFLGDGERIQAKVDAENSTESEEGSNSKVESVVTPDSKGKAKGGKAKEKSKAEKEKEEKEKQEKEKQEKEKAKEEKEKQEKEKQEKEKQEKERAKAEKEEKERLEKEKARAEKEEKERLEREKQEKEKLEKERVKAEKEEEKERLEKERQEKKLEKSLSALQFNDKNLKRSSLGTYQIVGEKKAKPTRGRRSLSSTNLEGSADTDSIDSNNNSSQSKSASATPTSSSSSWKSTSVTPTSSSSSLKSISISTAATTASTPNTPKAKLT